MKQLFENGEKERQAKQAGNIMLQTTCVRYCHEREVKKEKNRVEKTAKEFHGSVNFLFIMISFETLQGN